MPFIAGGYTAAVAATSIGQIEDGFTLEHSYSADPIRGDNYGDTVQDGVFRGGDMYLSGTFIEYNLALAKQIFWPWSATYGKLDDGMIGKLLQGMAFSLVLTAVSGLTSTPATLTATKCILAPGFPVSMLLAPRLRRVPVRFQLLPFTDTGAQYFFK